MSNSPKSDRLELPPKRSPLVTSSRRLLPSLPNGSTNSKPRLLICNTRCQKDNLTQHRSRPVANIHTPNQLAENLTAKRKNKSASVTNGLSFCLHRRWRYLSVNWLRIAVALPFGIRTAINGGVMPCLAALNVFVKRLARSFVLTRCGIRLRLKG